uniref:tRNA:m(4)X modification enzyme TRM13 n=1 Tax=Megaselia scalaris TaxID=36166 RepID=T1H6X0_MEGSC
HFVIRKKRFCRTVAKGKEYCGEHEPETDNSEEDADRIPCPLDGKHSVYRKNLHKHLKICNAKPKTDLPKYITGNNAGSDCEELLINSVNPKDEKPFKRIEDLYNTNVKDKISLNQESHNILSDELENKEYGKETKKHLIQNAAILKVMENEGFIKDNTSFVEFGAGKAQLSCWLVKLLESFESAQIVLVDRASLRHKKDNKLEDKKRSSIRADICDFLIDELEILNVQKLLLALKHLCGAATDLTLRCITKMFPKLMVFIALCCHHRCEWKSFVGKQFFQDNKVSRKDFVLITKLASYAICGTGMSRERRQKLSENQEVPIKAEDN